MDELLRRLEVKAARGDVEALWQAYYVQKRSLGQLTNKSLKNLRDSCQEELHSRTCKIYYGRTYGTSGWSHVIDIIDDDISIEAWVLNHLANSEYARKWHQYQPFRHLEWQPGSVLLYFRSKTNYTNMDNKVKPVLSQQVPSETILEPRYSYLVYLDDGQTTFHQN